MNTTLTTPTKTHLRPTQIANDTFVIHDHSGEGYAPVLVPLNAMVIRAAEPIVIDTGMAENRDQFLADVFSIVEPEDIRWVFISHDDIDHTGNLNALMELAPNATAVIDWFMQERMGASLGVSPLRQRWMADGDRLDLGDRTLSLVRPPVYDSPTTRGLFDPTTGVYWSSDSFATPMLTVSRHVSELDAGFWDEGMAMFNQYVSPWITMADDAKFQASVDRVDELDPSVIVGCHTPVIERTHIDQAMSATRRSPVATVPPQPDQAVLHEIQRALSAM
jgi:flavorubredoxin